MQTLILLLGISAAGLSLFAGLDYCFLRRNADIRLRRRLLLLAMYSSLLLPLLGSLIPLSLPRVLPDVAERMEATIELPTLWVNASEVAGHEAESSTSIYSLASLLVLLWGLGLSYMLGRLGVALWSLRCLLAPLPEAFRYQGIAVYRLPVGTAMGAFSFAGRIYIPEGIEAGQELSYILRHEAAHVRDGHHAERLLALLIRAVHWYLPTAWYLYNALDDTHEYIADRLTLAEHNSDTKVYQYQLLSSALASPHYPMMHAFNTNKQQLKKRIVMMNKLNISTRPLGWVWLLCLPIVCLMLWAGNSLTAAEQVGQAQEQEQPQSKRQRQKAQPRKRSAKTTPAKKAEQADPSVEEEIFEVVEELPEFPGKMEGMMKYLSENIKYPESAHKAGIQGRVVLQFVVEKDGSVSNLRVIRGVDEALDAEALRVVGAMPKWKPGMQAGKPVRAKYTVPIQFRLS